MKRKQRMICAERMGANVLNQALGGKPHTRDTFMTCVISMIQSIQLMTAKTFHDFFSFFLKTYTRYDSEAKYHK